MDVDGDGGRRELGLRGQRCGTESIVAEMVERRERMGVIAWFCCRWEQPEARTHQKTSRNNAFEQRTGLIRVGARATKRSSISWPGQSVPVTSTSRALGLKNPIAGLWRFWCLGKKFQGFGAG
jgi:hypothetical protein